ncbi:Crp/Fnr family transcriptional regulator [Mangrovicella endophytica]|uniref:Crp/Fnr family transcriptional regulator n=1 Tax=Mangrovicella endophytica TaxID=2066697 RepID=UPI000C9EA1EB|nr:Crp/Fnr family transcriptional regulator [Mangrovicella endophytica]
MTPPPASAQSLFLRRLQRNSILTTDEQQAVLKLDGVVLQVGANEEIVAPEIMADHAILVSAGCLGRTDYTKNGLRQITALYIPGDMADLQTVISPLTQSGIAAISASTVICIPHRSLRSLGADLPNVGLAFWRDTTVDTAILAKWVANIGRKPALSRVAHLLCEMGLRMERVGLGDRQNYLLQITQEQLGDAMGLTSVHVNRMLQQLRANALITTHGHMILIPDGTVSPLLPSSRRASCRAASQRLRLTRTDFVTRPPAPHPVVLPLRRAARRDGSEGLHDRLGRRLFGILA